MYKLIIQLDKDHVDELVIKRDVTTVGRRADNDIRLDDTTVSSHHAQFSAAGEKAYVEDLGSTNGTYVNGERIKVQAVADGDVIVIGKHKITYRNLPEEAGVQASTESPDATMQIDRRELDRLLVSAERVVVRSEDGRPARKVLNWIAQDPKGIWWGFEHEPHADNHGWTDTRNGVRILLKEDTAPTPNWRNTLQKI